MLTLQIAAGIVLAYIVIVNQKALLRFLKSSVFALAWVLAAAALAVGAAWLYGVVTDNLHTILNGTGFVLIFILYISSAVSLLIIWGRLFPKWKAREADDNKVVFQGIFFAVANALLVAAVAWPLLEFTVLGEWYGRLDMTSRANGYADSFAVLSNALLCQWTWLVVRRLRIGPGTADGAPE